VEHGGREAFDDGRRDLVVGCRRVLLFYTRVTVLVILFTSVVVSPRS
jgi:hypothetical protein